MTLSVKAGDYSTSVESKNGTYTVGMTRAQAQKKTIATKPRLGLILEIWIKMKTGYFHGKKFFRDGLSQPEEIEINYTLLV